MDSVVSEPVHPQRGLRRAWLVATVGVAVLVADQLSKSWAVDRLSPENSDGIHVVGDLWFRLAFNKGMAFSRWQGGGPIIALIAVAIIGVLAWYARLIHRRPQLVLIGVVMGGAAGNLVDRIARSGEGFLGGRVVDFIYVGWWPTFNVADAAIVVGGIALAVLLSFQPETPPDAATSPPSSEASSETSSDTPPGVSSETASEAPSELPPETP